VGFLTLKTPEIKSGATQRKRDKQITVEASTKMEDCSREKGITRLDDGALSSVS
jgi:hypothetical protein